MIAYDPSQPLVFIHVPKCAGTSIRPIVKHWFGRGFHKHYVNPDNGTPPHPINVASLPADIPQVIYGHFNAAIGLGVPDQYPQVRQFVTILRDPLDTAVSQYFYSLKRAEPVYKGSARAMARFVLRGGLSSKARAARRRQREAIHSFASVEDYVLKTGSQILNHFPIEVTDENYVEVIETMFVEIGVMEHLTDSLTRIAGALGKGRALPAIEHRNRGRKTNGISQKVADEFRARNALTYKVYDYVLQRYASPSDRKMTA